MLKTEGSGAALIRLMGSADKRVARRAGELLGLIYESPAQPNPSPRPGSKEEWLTWCKETGSKLPAGKLWSNFDMHFQ